MEERQYIVVTDDKDFGILPIVDFTENSVTCSGINSGKSAIIFDSYEKAAVVAYKSRYDRGTVIRIK